MAAQPTPSRPEPGSVALAVSDSRVRLVLAGELDLAVKTALLEKVREAARHDRPVEVDARRVTFMDSSALAALSRLVQLSDYRPVLIEPPEVVRFLLEVTRIGDLVDVVDHDGRPVTTAEQTPSRAGVDAVSTRTP